METNQKAILFLINKQMKAKISMKKGYRKKIKRLLERAQRKIARKIFSNSQVTIKEYQGTKLGCDTYGRDVENGIRKYIQLLKSRNIKFHTILVLGSRVKHKWNPNSDVDLTIIASDLPSEGTNAISKRLRALKVNVMFSDKPIYMGIEPSVLVSEREFLERLSKFDVEALDAVLYGRVVYDDGFWTYAMDKYSELQKKYQFDEMQLKEILLSS